MLVSTRDYKHFYKEFERCEPYLLDALNHDHGMFGIEDVLMGIIHNESHLWAGKKSAVVTQIVNYPRKTALHVFLAGGDIEELAEMYVDIAQWGRQQGCEIMTLMGRPGWTRSFLKDVGFKHTQHQMIKEL